jgi:hypothetical protein
MVSESTFYANFLAGGLKCGYSPARKLILCFVDLFYNTRLHYGKAHAQIIRACREFPVEMHLEASEMEAFRGAVGEEVLALPNLSFDPLSLLWFYGGANRLLGHYPQQQRDPLHQHCAA